MSFFARRAFSTTARRWASAAADASEIAGSKHNLKAETKRNPELMILGGVMACAIAGAGFYFGRTPTAATSEESVPISGMPWETGSTEGKYRYHPGGDRKVSPKDAPSAINVVVVPNVTLPKSLHDEFNKWGKDGY